MPIRPQEEAIVEELNHKIQTDPATGVIGELGFGTQILPPSGAAIRDEKIFGTFHLAIGRNDHLEGSVNLDRFRRTQNATHQDILFSLFKTPEIAVPRVMMHREGRQEVLIANYRPSEYMQSLIK